MRKISFAIFLIFLFSLTICGTAASKPNTLELCWQQYYYDYNEDLEPPEKSQEVGTLNGMRLLLSTQEAYNRYTRRISPVYGRFTFDFSKDNTVYNGSLINLQTGEVTPYRSSTLNTLINLEGDLGYVFKFTQDWRFVPYSGMGWRSWLRELSGTGSYSEWYTWWYLPVGLKNSYLFSEDLEVSLDATYKMMFAGELQVYLKKLDQRYNNPILALGNKPGYKIELPIYYKFLVFDPWYEYSAIGKSELAAWTYTYEGITYKLGDIYEPASETIQYGFYLGIRYKF